MVQKLMHGLLLLKVTLLAEPMPRSQGVCSGRAAPPSSVPHFQDLALIPGVGHWGGKPQFALISRRLSLLASCRAVQ